MPDRRTFLVAGAALSTAAALPLTPSPASVDSVAAHLDRYIGFGNKQAGGPGDAACGTWLAGKLERLGYKVERQNVATPYFTSTRAELVCGAASAPVWPQPIVVPTGPGGLAGHLAYVDQRGRAHGDLRGAIALVDLPASRWSTALAKAVREPIITAFAAGARAAVVITNGPTGKIIALNADGRKPMFAGPVALLAPETAAPFLAAAASGSPAILFVTGTGGRRPAFNFVGRIDRGRGRWLAVSTPRSGWFTCAGERGPGVAAWLWLAKWAATEVRDHDLAFICNSGHEYEYLGAAEALKAIAPPPDATRFWLHLGANVGATAWHEGTGKPLPSVDPERYLAVSPSLLPLARAAFAGFAGLEAPYSSEVLAAGELTEIIAAGYKPAAGVFGIHRFHHVAADDARCVHAGEIAKTAAAFQQMVERVLAAPI